jgi:hypothetical protein
VKDSNKSKLHSQIIYNLKSLAVRVLTQVSNIQKFYVLLTQSIYGFYIDHRTNSDYFAKDFVLKALKAD